LGLFFNKEKKASELYDAIVEEYDTVKKESAAENGDSPKIAWVTHFVYDGDEHFDVSFADYKTDLVADVNGRLPAESAQDLVDSIPGTRLASFSNTTVEFAWDGESSFESKEAARAAFQEFFNSLDAVVDETYAMEPSTYDFAEEFGFDTGSTLVYRFDGKLSASNGYDWFESSFVRPDLVLLDFKRIADSARQGENIGDFDFTWLRNIDEPVVTVSPSDCTRISSCSQEPEPICPFVQVCPDGSTALLTEDESLFSNSTCSYQSCDGDGRTAGSEDVTAETGGEKNTAQMAAPAVILITLLVVFVEALINFC